MRLAIVACLLLVATRSDARPYDFGDHTCSDAAVIATIVKQSYDRVETPPDVITLDVLLHVTFDVKRVLYGSVSRGPLRLNFLAHTEMNSQVSSWRIYLKRAQNGWRLAKCD